MSFGCGALLRYVAGQRRATCPMYGSTLVSLGDAQPIDARATNSLSVDEAHPDARPAVQFSASISARWSSYQASAACTCAQDTAG